MATSEKAGSDTVIDQSFPTTEVVHLLPCKIDYVGPAPVAEYFNATRSPVNGSGKSETASFRGRPLNGTEVELGPNGYRMYKATVVKSTENEDRTPKPSSFQLTGQIDRLMYWNLDKPTSHTDPLPKLMLYLGAARIFALDNDGKDK